MKQHLLSVRVGWGVEAGNTTTADKIYAKKSANKGLFVPLPLYNLYIYITHCSS